MNSDTYSQIVTSFNRTRMVTEMKRNAKERSAALAALRLAVGDMGATIHHLDPERDAKRFVSACGF